jgi:hypothetical protein
LKSSVFQCLSREVSGERTPKFDNCKMPVRDSP